MSDSEEDDTWGFESYKCSSKDLMGISFLFDLFKEHDYLKVKNIQIIEKNGIFILEFKVNESLSELVDIIKKDNIKNELYETLNYKHLYNGERCRV